MLSGAKLWTLYWFISLLCLPFAVKKCLQALPISNEHNWKDRMGHYFVLVLLLVLCIAVSVGLFSAFAGCILCCYICDFAVVVLCSVLPGTVRVGRRNAELSWLRFLAVVASFCCEVCVCSVFSCSVNKFVYIKE